MRTFSPAVAVCLSAALTGCATAPSEHTTARLLLADRTYLELKLPKGWSLEPSYADGRRLSQARFSAREPGSTQMWIIPLLEGAGTAHAGGAESRERARRGLLAGKDCEGVGAITQERSTAHGVAVFCTRPKEPAVPRSSLLPSTAGAVAVAGGLVRFAMLGVSDEESAAAWAILASMQVTTVASSP